MVWVERAAWSPPLLLTCVLLATEGAGASQEMRGVPLSLFWRYDSSSLPGFACDDNVREMPWSRVNDDFCDCADGSDEPGTSACSPAGRYYCVSHGPFSRRRDAPRRRTDDPSATLIHRTHHRLAPHRPTRATEACGCPHLESATV